MTINGIESWRRLHRRNSFDCSLDILPYIISTGQRSTLLEDQCRNVACSSLRILKPGPLLYVNDILIDLLTEAIHELSFLLENYSIPNRLNSQASKNFAVQEWHPADARLAPKHKDLPCCCGS